MTNNKGFNLVELMVTVAVISTLAAIAIPAYNGYVREGHFATMRASLDGLRVPIEDYRLENANYGATGTLTGVTAINGRFGWQPSGDIGNYTYAVSVTSVGSYDVWGVFNSNIWVRCDARFSNCCDSTTPSATAVSNNCPP
ncbi:type IV pilin protein [Thiosocius teredinicola]|uniref:type IV pilin protein n=1 Tax=Thiosocius teredinicola TaxID=1973002 RepID=UPI00099148C4